VQAQHQKIDADGKRLTTGVANPPQPTRRDTEFADRLSAINPAFPKPLGVKAALASPALVRVGDKKGR